MDAANGNGGTAVGTPVTEEGLRLTTPVRPRVAAGEVVDALRTLPPEEAVGELAARYWDAAFEVLSCATCSGAVPAARMPVRTVGVYYFRFSLGGIERVARELMLLWQRMGYDVVLITDDAPAENDQPLPFGVKRAYVPGWRSHLCGGYPERARALAGVLKAYSIDLLVYHEWMGLAMPWDALLAKLLGITFIVHAHGTFSSLAGYGGARHCALAPCYAFADGVACLSAVDERYWGTYNRNAHATPNPLSSSFADREPARLEKGSTVLWVGRLSKEKHLEEAFEAMRKVVAELPEARLVLVGSGPDDYTEQMRARAEELGLGACVEFAGEHTEEEMPSFYQRADVLLMTTHLEGYPLVLQEAMAMGVPCVMYDMPYLMLCADERGLSTVPMGNTSELARSVVALLSDADLRREAGAAAREHVADVQSFDRAAFWRNMFDASVTRHNVVRDFDGAADVTDLLLWQAVYDAVSEVQSEREGLIGELREGVSWLRKQLDIHQADLGALKDERDRLQRDLDAVTGSKSYRLGRALTAPFRLLRSRKEG